MEERGRRGDCLQTLEEDTPPARSVLEAILKNTFFFFFEECQKELHLVCYL